MFLSNRILQPLVYSITGCLAHQGTHRQATSHPYYRGHLQFKQLLSGSVTKTWCEPPKSAARGWDNREGLPRTSQPHRWLSCCALQEDNLLLKNGEQLPAHSLPHCHLTQQRHSAHNRDITAQGCVRGPQTTHTAKTEKEKGSSPATGTPPNHIKTNRLPNLHRQTTVANWGPQSPAALHLSNIPPNALHLRSWIRESCFTQ